MVRMTDEQFQKICNTIAYEDWDGWDFKFVEEINYCILVFEYDGKQIHVKIDIYGNVMDRYAVLWGEEGYV